MITKTGHAKWNGDLKTGTGSISGQSGAFENLPFGFNTRFDGETGTNPEELIGASHAGCFSMALSNILGGEDIVADSIETSSAVTLEKLDDGFAITKIHLTTTIKASGADAAKVEECAQKAKVGCPISKLFNADITLETTIQT